MSMKKPVVFSTNPGTMRMPTTLCLVRPGPGHWVCFCLTISARWKRISREQDEWNQEHMEDVEPGQDLRTGELATEQRRGDPGAGDRNRQDDRVGDA